MGTNKKTIFDIFFTSDEDIFIAADSIGCCLDDVLADARAELLLAGKNIKKKKKLDASVSLFDANNPDLWKDVTPEALSTIIKKGSNIIAMVNAEDLYNCISIEVERKDADEFTVNNLSVSYESWNSLLKYLAKCGIVSKDKARSLCL